MSVSHFAVTFTDGSTNVMDKKMIFLAKKPLGGPLRNCVDDIELHDWVVAKFNKNFFNCKVNEMNDENFTVSDKNLKKWKKEMEEFEKSRTKNLLEEGEGKEEEKANKKITNKRPKITSDSSSVSKRAKSGNKDGVEPESSTEISDLFQNLLESEREGSMREVQKTNEELRLKVEELTERLERVEKEMKKMSDRNMTGEEDEEGNIFLSANYQLKVNKKLAEEQILQNTVSKKIKGMLHLLLTKEDQGKYSANGSKGGRPALPREIYNPLLEFLQRKLKSKNSPTLKTELNRCINDLGTQARSQAKKKSLEERF